KEAASLTYDEFLTTLSATGIPSRSGMEILVKAIQSQGRHVDRRVSFNDIADDRLATEVARELGYKIPSAENTSTGALCLASFTKVFCSCSSSSYCSQEKPALPRPSKGAPRSAYPTPGLRSLHCRCWPPRIGACSQPMVWMSN